MNLDEIEARANAAMPGPWRHRPLYANTSQDRHLVEHAVPAAGYPAVARDAWKEDAAFIAAARADVPALIARVRELEAERDEARAQLAAADTGAPCDGHRHCCADRRKLAEELLRVRAERDALKEKPCA